MGNEQKGYLALAILYGLAVLALVSTVPGWLIGMIAVGIVVVWRFQTVNWPRNF